MADSVFSAPNNGAVGMPSVDNAMNKVAPSDLSGGKGSKDDARLGADKAKEQKLLERARKRMDRCISGESDNRKDALDDLKQYKGDQWPADVRAQRNFDNRPCLTINKFPTFVNQVTNDVRQNRPSINVSPVGDRGDPEVAKMYAGMIREIERKSVADIAYDTAFANVARCGYGAWRVVTEYEKPNSLHQVATIKRIRNPFTVYFDPAHQEPDASDAKFCFVTEMIPRSEFEDDYPDADPMNWRQAGQGDTKMSNWIGKDEVRIAEYFEVENEKRVYVLLSNGSEGWEDELEPTLFDQFEVIAERESDVPKVKWYKMTAVEVIEEREWPGKWIPVVKVIGDEVDIEGKPFYWGIIRMAKDAQRMFNYLRTSYVEAVALVPKAPYVMAEGQDEGYEAEWKQANTKSFPALHYRPTTLENHLVPPPQRQPPVPVPQGLEVAASDAAQDMMATTGIRFDSTKQERMYDESGRALRELRKTGEIGTFHYVDNLTRSLRHTGEILVDLIPKLYDRRRITTILRENDSEERVMIDPAHPSAMGEMKDSAGKVVKIFNPTYGEYGVTVTIGPSYATKRVEAAESMMDFMRALAPAQPQAITAIMDLIAKNQDWHGAEEIQGRLAKVVAQLHPGIMDMQMKDVPPQLQALLMGAQQQVKQLSQEKAQLTLALNDRNADRAVQMDKQEKDFESKLLAIAQKAEAAQQTTGAQIKELVDAVTAMRQLLSPPTETRVQ